MPKNRQARGKTFTSEDYEKFKKYLSIMHEKAVEIMNILNHEDRRYIEKFFTQYYPTKQEHYWSLKKLFCLAMYIPIFLQIGMSAVERGIFDTLIYIDTHSGPGLAKVGADPEDIVLGSPTLAITWPQIIADKVKTFRKIQNGFNKLYFVEKDHKTYAVLQKIVQTIGNKNIELFQGDVNHVLPAIKKKIKKQYRKPLILMFIDPYGEFSTQIQHNRFYEFVKDWAVDIVFNIMSPNLVRGIKSKKNNTALLRTCIRELWGDLCEEENREEAEEKIREELEICNCYEQPRQCNIRRDDIVKAYIARLILDGYTSIGVIPVKYEGKILYHLAFASKGKNSQTWLGNYMEYLRNKAPNDYDTLRNLWLQATGRQLTLNGFFRKNNPPQDKRP